jgi:hypothetical protein
VIAGRYSLRDEVGRGGMGVVWRGEDEVLGRPVALKRVGMMPGGASLDLARAEREARLAASLNHPHVVSVFDLVTHGDEQWLVMEYVESTNLAQLVREQGPLSPDRAARLLCQAAEALAAAHRAGIVHRDVKPSNILVTPAGQVKLTDFGIARASADATLTQTGMMTGSPAYLAPEIASGGTASAASDVWALGATVFHALTGRPPYDASGNVMGALYQIVHEDPPRPDDAGWLTPLLEATMTKDPEDRWSMERVARFLSAGNAAGSTQLTEPLPAEPTTRIAPTPPSGRPPKPAREGSGGGQRRLLLAGLAAVALIVALVLGWNALAGGDDDPDTAGDAPGETTEPTEEQPEPEPEPEEPQADAGEMEAFVTDYLATVTADPRATWSRLTPQFQEASGGFGSYRGFWSTIRSAEPSGVSADPEAMTVSYTVDYTRNDGSTWTDQVTLELAMDGEDYLVAGES